ncbi:sds3-like domain-containing protein [Ditylenchus destructor]|nr:sds3-like domain-containing protein [Ditylenchus destructor]
MTATKFSIEENGLISDVDHKKILCPLSEHKRNPVNEEESQLKDESHTAYLLEVEKIEEEYNRELELIDILEKGHTERIEAAYKVDEEAIASEYEIRLNEMVESLYNEYEEKKKVVETEVNSMDIASSQSTSSAYFYGYPNKKTLRRRANEQSEATERKQRKHSPQNIVHLLPESDIAQDVKLICNYPSGTTATVLRVDEDGRHRKVTIDNTRLVCDGKIFHRGQNVSVETVNYGRFPAIIQTICEKFVQFRSIMAGDTRQVTATTKDFECGRVIVRKRY